VRFAFIQKHRDDWPLSMMCRVLSVSRSGFYAWRDRPLSPRRQFQEELAEVIHRVHQECRGVYGSPRLTVELNERGVCVCENTVARIMRREGVAAQVRRRFVPQTTDSNHPHPIAANVLDRQFDAAMPNRKWVCDITYVRTDEGWLYLAGVMDLCSRKIVGWAMDQHMRAELVSEALKMAVSARRPAPGLLHHSDRGVQYACCDYRQILQSNGIHCSMSRTGNCWDNAAMESFWSTLKRELVNEEQYATRAQAKASIFEYIEVFYNRKRRHSSLGYVSPEQFEASLN
jgi:putative transposase